MSVVVIGLSHRTSPVELRERFAFAEGKIPDALKSLRDSGLASEAAILAWKNEAEHLLAQKLGKTDWYAHYEVRVARVERAYGGP